MSELHTAIRGDGPAFVWAHGFGGSARNFGPQVRALRDRYRVVCYDARGHARSRDIGGPFFGMSALRDDLGKVIAGQGAEPCLLGGLSLGAATALEFSLHSPERVSALVLASPPAGRAASGGIASQAAAFASAVEARGLEAAGEEFVWGPSSGLDARGAALVRQGFLEHSPAALAAILRDTLDRLDAPAVHAEALAATGIPVLVIVGGRDTPSLEAAREFVARGPSIELAVIEGAGHVVNLEAAEAFNAELERFLSRRL